MNRRQTHLSITHMNYVILMQCKTCSIQTKLDLQDLSTLNTNLYTINCHHRNYYSQLLLFECEALLLDFY